MQIYKCLLPVVLAGTSLIGGCMNKTLSREERNEITRTETEYDICYSKEENLRVPHVLRKKYCEDKSNGLGQLYRVEIISPSGGTSLILITDLPPILTNASVYKTWSEDARILKEEYKQVKSDFERQGLN